MSFGLVPNEFLEWMNAKHIPFLELVNAKNSILLAVEGFYRCRGEDEILNADPYETKVQFAYRCRMEMGNKATSYSVIEL